MAFDDMSIDWLYKRISLVSVSSIGIIMIFLLLIFNVISLQLGESVPLFRKLSIFILVWVVFVSQGSRRIYEANIRISYFFNRLPVRLQRTVSAFENTIAFVTNVALIASGILGVLQVRGTTTSVANIPVELLYLPLVVGITIAVVLDIVDVGSGIRERYGDVR